MFVPLLQMLLVPWLGNADQRAELQEKSRVPQDGDVLERHPMDNGEAPPTHTRLFMARLLAEMESRKQGLPKASQSDLPHNQAMQDFRSYFPTSTSSPMENTRSPLLHPHRRRETKPPFRRDAKKFWDLFMLKTKSRSEEIVLPIKTIEMEQEMCKTIPFSQSIVHETCEKVELENNLCFGRCSSFHVPGPEDRMYTFCSHCSPIKFSMRRLEMNCTTTATAVTKLVMIVEECKCVIQKTKGPVSGFLHSDPQADDYDHS